ncbi:hypothetical protein [Nocardia terpenica]|uniref:hypothetical protein n=1 Tax=Nocardia terpenica TaxID=455432 RepID=UPI000319B870|nr:hypothetical protein [Nocardia terpenica]NQE89802.1 hypothetical protein [Nocardia terpenica]
MTDALELERLCADYNRRWNADAFVDGYAVVFHTGRLQILTIPGTLAAPLQRALDRRGVFAPSFEHVDTGVRSFLVTTNLRAVEDLHRWRRLLDRSQPTLGLTVSRQRVALPSGSESTRWIVAPVGADDFPDLAELLRIADEVRETIVNAGGSRG